MSLSPALAELLVELHRVRAADRRAILARLEPSERLLVGGHLEELEERAQPRFDALATLSPWLAESLAEARSGASDKLTAATREALAEAERLLPRDKPPPGPRLAFIDKLLRRGRVR